MTGMNTRNTSLRCKPRSADMPPQMQAAPQRKQNKNQSLRSMPRIYHIALLIALALPAFAQKAAMPNAWTQLGDALGAPCAGCFLYQFVAGSTTPQNTYTTPGGGVANNNPLALGADGTANIWLTPGQTYRFDLYTPQLVLIRSIDNVPGGTLLGQSAVTANYVLAGPTTGAAATPTFRALVAADFAALFTPTTCTNQFLTAISSSVIGTCSTDTLASAQHANQGTTTTLLHGNAAGNPSWTNVLGADFGSSIAARSALVRASASTGAPAFGTTIDVLAYQVAEIPAFNIAAADFTTSGVGTALEAITGLTFTVPANTALIIPFSCKLIYSQAVANDVVAFGVQTATVSPTNISAEGIIYTNTTASTEGNLPTLTTTTATAVVSATPAATATNYIALVSGLYDAPSNASSTAFKLLVSTATAADLVTVRKGSYCRWN